MTTIKSNSYFLSRKKNRRKIIDFCFYAPVREDVHFVLTRDDNEQTKFSRISLSVIQTPDLEQSSTLGAQTVL